MRTSALISLIQQYSTDTKNPQVKKYRKVALQTYAFFLDEQALMMFFFMASKATVYILAS